ncbi:MAG TPA: haloacid dehalogenase type II [Candidatus Baltobacteraceae bacterium]|nr:haloacid dehalogenase type II [Candidatus Baltobacteraceae bacterium]
MAVSVVCFDLYGTLFDLDGLEPLVREYTPMAEAMCEEWRRRQLQLAGVANSSGRYMDFDRVTLVALHEIAPRFHLRLAPSDQKRLIDAWAALPVFDDVLPALQTITTRKLPILALTNAVASTARNALAHAEIAEYFRDVLSADTVKVYKPNAAVYGQVTTNGLYPEDVLFFSSNDWDAMGASQAGFHSVWVNRRGALAGMRNERTIPGLHAVESVLDELGAGIR